MKRVFIIAAVLIAALPMAHATSTITYSFLGSSETPSPATFGSSPDIITITAYRNGTLTGTCNSPYSGPYCITGAITSGVNVSYDAAGLGIDYPAGVNNNPPADPYPQEIAYFNSNSTNNFVVIDFSNPIKDGYTSASIVLDNVTHGYAIYKGPEGTPSSLTGLTGLQLATSGLGSTTVSVPLSTAYPALVFLADCGVDVLNIKQITVSTPEPGTFVMAGMALIGLGVALRKACKR